MNTDFNVNVSMDMNAPMEKVWDALTNPATIKQYMFGADVITDWTEGGSITWKGEWQGKPFEDVGKIIKIVPGQLLQYTHNYAGAVQENVVTYTLAQMGDKTQVTITQTGSPTAEARDHSEKNWNTILESIKGIVES